MTDASAGTLADRVARQLGLDAADVAGSGPNGAATVADVLRRAGRSPPAAARPPPPRTAFRMGGAAAEDTRRLEVACDARPLRDACGALAALAPEPPRTLDVVARLCGAALRDHPELAAAADGLVIRTPDGPEIRVEGAATRSDRGGGAVLFVAERSGSILLGLELTAGPQGEVEAFLNRLRSLCLDPRRALL